jgi:hypothetical protein
MKTKKITLMTIFLASFAIICLSGQSVFAVDYTVTFNAGTGGSLSGTASQTVPEGMDCSTVSAVPDTAPDYHFVNWSIISGVGNGTIYNGN